VKKRRCEMFDHNKKRLIEACGASLDDVRKCLEDAIMDEKGDDKWSGLIEGVYKQADKYPLEVLLLAAVSVGKAMVDSKCRMALSLIRVMVKGGRGGLFGKREE